MKFDCGQWEWRFKGISQAAQSWPQNEERPEKSVRRDLARMILRYGSAALVQHRATLPNLAIPSSDIRSKRRD